jgi:hypothetical protein
MAVCSWTPVFCHPEREIFAASPQLRMTELRSEN